MYKYRYPNDLSAKTYIYLWTPVQLCILAVLVLIGISAYFKSHNYTVLMVACAFGVMTMKFLPDTKTAWEFILDYYYYLSTPQYFEYDGKVHNEVKPKVETTKQVSEYNIANDSGSIVKYIVLAILTIILVLGADHLVNSASEKATSETIANITLKFTSNVDAVIEWGSNAGTIDAKDFIVSNDLDVTASPSTIDTTKVGETLITYTVTDKEGNEKEFEKTFTIEDTQLPIISFYSESVTVTKDSEFNPTSNISSVMDPNGGNLYKDAETGGYTVESNVDTSIPGTYEVKVIATDVNGNQTENAYSVTVTE